MQYANKWVPLYHVVVALNDIKIILCRWEMIVENGGLCG